MNKIKRRFFIAYLVLFFLFSIFTGGYFAIAKSIPGIDEIRSQKDYKGTKIYADDNTLIGEITIEKGIHVPLSSIPAHLINAVIATEDERFFRHKGLDYIAIARALITDIIHGQIKQGGSTITQQLAKIMFLTPERTLSRKVKEAFLALKFEKYMTKNEILELYLNRVYFGHGAYGVEMASRVYFGKSVKDLKLSESAILAGLIRAPAIYSPYNNIVNARERQIYVLQRMVSAGFINMDEFKKASSMPIILAGSKSDIFVYNYFIDYIKKYLEKKYGEDMVYRGGLKVYTTLDREKQLSAYMALRKGLREIDKRRGWRGPVAHKDIENIEKESSQDRIKEVVVELPVSKEDIIQGIVIKVSPDKAIIKARGMTGTLPITNAMWAQVLYDKKTNTSKTMKRFNLTSILKPGDVIYVGIKNIDKKKGYVEFTLEQEPEIEGAIVALETYTGFIKAMVGGYDYTRSEYNRAIYARRQPGSAFKPIIYASALENGYTQASIIMDEPTIYDEGTPNEWSPKNYDEQYWGPTPLVDALAYSRNVVTVKLLESIGIEKVLDFANRVGINNDMPRDLSLALGSMSLSPLELTSVYNTFASYGMRPEPSGIKYIVDMNGNIIEENQPDPEEVLDEKVSFLITTMMKNVVEYGTGWRAKELGRPVAGKTGTTNEYRDAWFIGYTPDLVAGVWVGYDDMRPIGEHETGARAALPIWLHFMKSIDLGPINDFPVPEGIVAKYVDKTTGLLSERYSSNTILEYFIEGTEPREFSTYEGIEPLPSRIEKPEYD